jgi:hypothetical protein
VKNAVEEVLCNSVRNSIWKINVPQILMDTTPPRIRSHLLGIIAKRNCKRARAREKLAAARRETCRK